MEGDDKVIRQMIVHENELTSQRVQWLLTAQGLLFAALAVSLKEVNARPLVMPVCLLGVAVALATILNVCFATQAVGNLVAWWSAKEESKLAPPVIGVVMKPGSILNYFSPSNLISIAMIVGWCIVYRRFA